MKTLRLSPIDHAFAGRDSYSVEFLMLFPYHVDGELLKDCLEAAAKRFWPIKSELAKTSDGYFQFQSVAYPLAFSVRDGGSVLPDFYNPRELAKFSEPVQSLPGEKLAKFCLTHVGDHSVFVANISHAMVDGYSYFFFLSTVAALYRNAYRFWRPGYWKTKAIHPDHDRSRLNPRGPSTSADGAIDPQEFFRRTGFSFAGKRTLPSLEQSKWQFIRFEPDELLNHLKAHDPQLPERLSKHDIVTALLWKHVAKEWHHGGDEMLECSSAFDYRRVHGNLSPLYWGNAVRGTTCRVSRDEILSLGVTSLAVKIRQATKAINRDAVFDSLQYLDDVRRIHGPEVFGSAQIAHPKVGFLVTNLSRIDADSFDLGSGAPIQVIPLTAAPRAAVLLSEGDAIVARVGIPDSQK